VCANKPLFVVDILVALHLVEYIVVISSVTCMLVSLSFVGFGFVNNLNNLLLVQASSLFRGTTNFHFPLVLTELVDLVFLQLGG
jgi:hypothetical protein